MYSAKTLEEILKSDDYIFKIKCLINILEFEARTNRDEEVLEKCKDLMNTMFLREFEKYQNKIKGENK